MNIYLVTWQYAKKTGIVGAYPTKEAAERVLDLLVTHGDLVKKFALLVMDNVDFLAVQEGG